MICVNKKCKKYFDEKVRPIKIKRNQKIIECPFCGLKYNYIKYCQDFQRISQGNGKYQLVRKQKKVRMSKKERLKIRKLQSGKI
jgi:hypothetical protein